MIRPSTRRDGERQYTGVLRRGNRVVAECGHVHVNRTDSYPTSGRSAVDCARDLLAAARGEALAVSTAVRLAGSWARMPAASTGDVERNKVAAAEMAAAYEQRVAAVRALLADEPAEPEQLALDAPAEPVGDPTDPVYAWMFS